MAHQQSPYNPAYGAQNPGYPPPNPGYQAPNAGYPPLPMNEGGYPPYPPGPAGGDTGYSAPPPGYAYPPIPIPVGQHNLPVTTQPMGGPMHPTGFYDIQRGGYYNYGQPMEKGYGGAQSVPLNVPPGLEYLTQIDSLIVKQKVELLEAFLGCETNNKYKIKNMQGQEIYSAKENTDCCTRNCCGALRPFDIKIKDGSDKEVIHLSRPLACSSCWCPCWLQTIEVFAPPGQLAGTVEQEWSLCSPKFVVKNTSGDVVLRIEGPFCTYSCCGSVEFEILSKDGSTKVGKISKKWSGLLREAFTDADNFGIQFPMDLDVRMKAVMLGACFLIDFMFFEKSGNNETDGVGML